jgi:hypothetical protein
VNGASFTQQPHEHRSAVLLRRISWPVAIAYRCDPKLRCTFVVWHGDVTPAEFRAHADRMFVDPAFPPGPNLLGDLRTTAANASSVTNPALREIGERWTAKARVLPNMRFALMPNEAWNTTRRVVEKEIVTATIEFGFFDDVHDAAQWLGLEATRAEAILDKLRGTLHAW